MWFMSLWLIKQTSFLTCNLLLLLRIFFYKRIYYMKLSLLNIAHKLIFKNKTKYDLGPSTFIKEKFKQLLCQSANVKYKQHKFVCSKRASRRKFYIYREILYEQLFIDYCIIILYRIWYIHTYKKVFSVSYFLLKVLIVLVGNFELWTQGYNFGPHFDPNLTVQMHNYT